MFKSGPPTHSSNTDGEFDQTKRHCFATHIHPITKAKATNQAAPKNTYARDAHNINYINIHTVVGRRKEEHNSTNKQKKIRNAHTDVFAARTHARRRRRRSWPSSICFGSGKSMARTQQQQATPAKRSSFGTLVVAHTSSPSGFVAATVGNMQ